jgi:hypothetical protein
MTSLTMAMQEQDIVDPRCSQRVARKSWGLGGWHTLAEILLFFHPFRDTVLCLEFFFHPFQDNVSTTVVFLRTVC